MLGQERTSGERLLTVGERAEVRSFAGVSPSMACQ